MKTKIFLVILICFLLYTSCSKDKGCNGINVEYKNLSQTNKNLIPYKGRETLTFLHVNTGDTETFIGEPMWTSYSNSSFGGADCVIETRREGRGISYVNKSKSKQIVFNQYIGATTSTYFEITFEELNVFTRLLFSDDKFKDSITIQGKKYFNIYFYSNDDVSPKPQDYGCYYTRTDGILKLFTKTGDVWEIISKN